MNLTEKFIKIANLAKAASGKRMSELSREEQHAVLFLGNYFPASALEGKISYDKTADTYTLSCAYVEARKINKSVNADCKFSSKTFHILPDIEVDFPSTISPKEALEAYPEELKIPDKKFETCLKPLLDLDSAVTIAIPRTRIATTIMRIYWAIVFDENTKVGKAHYEILKRPEEFKELANKLKIPEDVQEVILNSSPRQATAFTKTMVYKDKKMSFLATYLYHVTNFIQLVPEVDEIDHDWI